MKKMHEPHKNVFHIWQNVHCIQVISILTIVFIATITSATEARAMHTKREIIQIDKAVGNENLNETQQYEAITENAAMEVQNTKDVIENEDNNSVNNVKLAIKEPNSAPANVEQKVHYVHETTNSNAGATSSGNVEGAKADFTKGSSEENGSIENRLSSTLGDESKVQITKTSPVSVKETTKSAEVPVPRMTSTNPLEKLKRVDNTFQHRSTDRVPTDSTTISESSDIDNVSARAKSKITSITPEIVTEKRAKYLSDAHTRSSAPSNVGEAEPEIWSNLKTVGEVNHNNVTFSRPGVDDLMRKPTINGKLDIDDMVDKDKDADDKQTSTERVAGDHDTQLQKNSSLIDEHVQQDNSLTTFQLVATNRSVHQQLTAIELPKLTTDLYTTKRNRLNTTVESTNPNRDVVQPTKKMQLTALSSTERNQKSEEELVEKATENEFTSTTVEQGTTTEDVDETTFFDKTTISIEQKPNAKYSVNTEGKSMQPTTMPPSGEAEPNTTVYPASKESNESTDSVQRETTQSQSVEEEEGTTKTMEFVPMTTTVSGKSHGTTSRPTKPMVLKPTEKITSSNSTEQEDLNIYVNKSTTGTQRNAHQAVTLAAITTPLRTTESERSTASREYKPRIIPTTEGTDVPSSIETVTVKGTTARSPLPTERPADIGSISHYGDDGGSTDINAVIAISVSIVAVVTLILLVGFLFVMRKRQKQLTYGQRCRPVGLDAYSLDNISVYNSVRRKSAMRASKRAFGNAGFDDPSLKNNLLNITQLATFSQKRVTINDEFRDIPLVTARIDEVPPGCEDKNRYANVVPLPESRVHLKRIDDDEKTEYINANFVRGPKDTTNYYIACQAPLENTIIDFWRMIWENNSRVIIMATDLTENGIEKCAEYLPSSFVIDNHVTFGDFQITLKNREVRDKYAVSTVHIKNSCTKTWREITHFWYQWPENGIPNDEASIIAMLLEARSYLKMVVPEQSADANGQQESDLDEKIGNGSTDKSKSLQKVQGPLTVHCSPGTGRTGAIIACDIAIRSLELPTRSVDIPQIVYFVRRGRASAVQTREQYEFIYKVAHVYATKLTGTAVDS